jgi:hypothetical protein
MSGGSGNRTEKGGKRVDINGIKVRTENRTLENTSGRGERRRRVIGKKDGDSDIIEEMSQKRKERKRSTRRSKSMPDDLTIDGIISGLDIQEGNDGVMTMLEKVSMHKFMETHSLIKSTSMGTEATLGKIKGRRGAGKKRSKRELEKLTEDGSK